MPDNEKRNASAVDLKALSIAELRGLSRDAAVMADQKTEAEKRAVLADARAKLAELGVDFDAMLRAPPAKSERRRGRPPKVRPANAAEEALQAEAVALPDSSPGKPL